MNKNSNAVYAIKLMSCVLNKSAPVAPESEIDWYSFRGFCERHCISNIVAYGINALDLQLPDDIKAYFNEVVYQSLAKEARLEVEISELTESFEKNKIPHMLLKGSVIKNYYPQPDMRSMCDVDILVGNNLNEAMSITCSHGFQLKARDNLHDCYFKKPFINLELHSSLFDEELTDLYSYFKIGFERANLLEDCKYRYTLLKEDFYIFMLAHFAKHFKRTGVGIRSVADVYVFLKNNPSIDFGYIEEETEKIGLLKFAQRIQNIAISWFDEGIVNTDDSVQEYIISSGAYGSTMNLELNRFLQNKNNRENYTVKKLKYYINVILPDFKYMCARYPQLEKRRYLLPFYWIKRIFYTFIKSKGSISYRLGRVSKSDKSYLDKFSDFD
ncbi:MAG: nucleotidyltransferase family protein [Clostridia bacterium]|nr:nucleotidyltransferase family protein [Clostridia bacterium]